MRVKLFYFAITFIVFIVLIVLFFIRLRRDELQLVSFVSCAILLTSGRLSRSFLAILTGLCRSTIIGFSILICRTALMLIPEIQSLAFINTLPYHSYSSISNVHQSYS